MRSVPALLVLLLPLAVGCVTPMRYVSKPQIIMDAYDQRRTDETLPAIEIPFALDEDLRAFAEEAARGELSPRKIAMTIGAAIVSEVGGEGLAYESYENLTAVEAFHARSGNCLAFTNLFVAMARAVGLPAVYVLVDHIDQFEEVDHQVVAMRHMCAGFYYKGSLRLVDFGNYDPSSYWDVVVLSDWEAVAHHYNNLGYSAFREGDHEQALRLYRTALVVDPTFAPALGNLALVLRRQGLVEEAAATLEQAVELAPGSIPALSNLASVYRELGHEQKAQEAEERIEVRRATSSYHQFVMARLQRERGDLPEAARMLRLAAAEDRRNALIFLELASVYRELGELDKALHAYRKARRLDPNSGEAREGIRSLERLDVLQTAEVR